MGAAWLCLHLWERYEFTMDKEFLEKVYPTMKEACEFFVDYLVEDSEGRLVTCPSLSPENSYRRNDGYVTSICAGATMDNGILCKLFSSTIEAAHILGLDEKFTSEIRGIKKRLPELKIGHLGTIMEWLEDYEEVEIGHRHISQLFSLYPGGEITPLGTPELAQAARRTLERRLSHGGGHTGWSCAWIINMWARLWDGENAHKYVQTIIAKSTYPNMFDAHPPFQIDGNFGVAAGITEMLFQSNEGVLNILPALPKAWPQGYIKGIKARGNYEIDLEWSKGRLTKAVINTFEATIRNPTCKTVKVRCRNSDAYIVKCKEELVPLTREDDILSFTVIGGQRYIIEEN